MNGYLVFILATLIGTYLLGLLASILNVRNIKPELPGEFEGWYDAEKYRRSQEYLRENTRFGMLASSIRTALTLAFLLAGGFAFIDNIAWKAGEGEIVRGLVFAGLIGLVSELVGLPFAVYRTFVIEERYGFNKTTPRTFVLDILKGLLLAVLIGGPIFALVIALFDLAGPLAWLYCWGAVTAFQLVMGFLAPYIIMPLFNKFTPLEEGELRTAIQDYADRQKFRMKGIFKMDGSRRSAKTNAFFTGLGRSKRIVLFDTLIAKHTVGELVAIVAHEMGHFKKGHIPRGMLRGILHSGLMFAILSIFLKNPGMFEAFRIDATHLSVYASLFFFGFLYTPMGMVLSVAESIVSRAHEYEADRFAAETTGRAEDMITGLKKLSVDNLSNLTPHPFVVFMYYSHPPVLERIRALRTAPDLPSKD